MSGASYHLRSALAVLIAGLCLCSHSYPQTVPAAGRVSTLLKDLENEKPAVRCDAAQGLGRMGAAAKDAVPALIRALHDVAYNVPRCAIAALGSLGPAAEPAVPALIAELHGPTYSAADIISDILTMRPDRDIADALVKLDRVAVPGLIQALHDKSDERRLQVISILERIGQASVDAAPALMLALQDQSELVRAAAASALGRLWRPPRPVIPFTPAVGQPQAPPNPPPGVVSALANALADSTVSVRRAAALMLAEFGSASEPALPALLRAIQDPSDSVRQSACRALGAIGPAASEAVPMLTDALIDRNDRVRERAEEALHAIGAARGGSIPALIAATQDPKQSVRWNAVSLLAQKKPVTPEITAALIRSLHDPDRQIRDKVFELLTPSDDAVSALASLLSADDGTTRWSAARALARFGPAAKGAVPALVESLNAGEPGTHEPALDALAAIGGPDALPALVNAARAESNRFFALYALARTGPEGLRLVAGMARSGTDAERVDAVQVLPVNGAQNRDALPVLIAALKDRNEAVRKSAAAGLGASHDASPEVAAALFVALDDESVRQSAASAIGASEAALGWVAARLGDADESVRRRAAGALGLIGEAASSYSTPAATRQAVTRVSVPALVAALADDSEPVRLGAVAALRQFRDSAQTAPALSKALEDRADAVRFAAALSLVHIGFGRQVLGVLVASLSDRREERRAAAAAGLMHIEGAAAQAAAPLLAALRDPAAPVRRAAALSLVSLGTRLPETVPVLAAALRDTDRAVRDQTLDALSRFEPMPREVVPSAVAALRDVGSFTRQRAIKPLAATGEAEALSAVVAALLDEDSWVRQAAAEAVAQMTPIPAAAVSGLIRASDARESYLRTAALRALERAQPQTPEIQSRLIASLWERNDSFRFDRPSTAAQLEPSAVPALIHATDARRGPERATGVAALGEMGVKAREAAPYIISLLMDGNDQVRSIAAASLGKISPPPETAVPALLEALRDPSAEVQVRAAAALGQLGPAARDAVPALVALIGADWDKLRGAAADGLAGIGAAAVPPLLALFEPQVKPGSTYPDNRRSYGAADILVRIGASDPAAAPLFVSALRSGVERLRVAAATALGKTDADPREAIPALRAALQDDSDAVRRAALAALGSRGAAAKEALDGIVALLGDRDWWRRSEAMTALRRIVEGLQDGRDVSENARLASVVASLSTATRQEDVYAPSRAPESWDADLRQLRRSVDALQAIEKELLLSRGAPADQPVDPTLEGFIDFDLDSPIDIDGKSVPANVLLIRGDDKQLRVNPNGASVIRQAEGFVTAYIRATRQKLTLIKEEGKLRLFRPYRNSYAILIAISDYPAASGYAPIAHAVDQANQLEKALKAQGFLVIKKLYDRDATAENIRAALRNPPVPITSEDRLFIYFGGHGDDVQRLKRIGLIVPYGANKKDLSATGIPLEELRTAAGLLPAKQILFALDSCQSGLLITREPDRGNEDKLRALSDIEAMSRKQGLMFLTAGTGGQPALDVNGGIFTNALIQGIEGKVDGGSRGVVTFYMLYAHIRSVVNNSATRFGRVQDPAAEVTPPDSGWVFVVDRSLVP